jgi:hypothetical protein
MPLFIRGPSGEALEEIDPALLRADIYWDGRWLELPILRVEQGGRPIRVTILLDNTPEVVEGNRTRIVRLVSNLINFLELDDEIRFIIYGGERSCEVTTAPVMRDRPPPSRYRDFRVDDTFSQWEVACCQERLDIRDGGNATIRDLYSDMGRYCWDNREAAGGRCKAIRNPRDATLAMKIFLEDVLGKGRGDADYAAALASAVANIEGVARNAVVIASDFRYQCETVKDPLAAVGTYSRDVPLTLSLVRVDPRVPAPPSSLGDLYRLESHNGKEIARSILERVPPVHVVVLDAREFCEEARGCPQIELKYGPEGSEDDFEVFTERCPKLANPRAFVKTIRRIRDPENRADYVRSMLLFRDSEYVPYIITALQGALEKEKKDEVRRAILYVLGELRK